jgi:osmotically-inducible protein OsmY
MAGNWMDDRERQIRERDGRGFSDYRSGGGEDRSWDRAPERDRVFGERESGASYGRAGLVGARSASASRGWQDRHYGGVSPAMRQGEYEQGGRIASQGYAGGGRFYGDDDHERIYREEYGQGGYDAQRSPTREQYHTEGYGRPGYGGYPGEQRRDFGGTASGGVAGYDYGYGDSGRRDSRGDRFEDAGRGAGEFLHRAGRKVASWFNAGGEGRIYDPDYFDPTYGKRGLGPQGYKRSDERISDEAHERLTDDHWLDASNISVSVSEGEVTLSGAVESREAKHRAERLIEDLSGVTHVQNNLRLAKGNYLTSASPGYGDSVLGAQMRAADDAVGNGTGGSGSGQSTAGRKN